LSVGDAEHHMLKAAANFKSRCMIKLGQGVGVGIRMPQDPGFEGVDDGTGAMLQRPFVGEETGELLGVPPLEPDTTRPGFAVGGQTEQELAAAGGGAGSNVERDLMELVDRAVQSGQKQVFDHATVGALARTYDSSAVIDYAMPTLIKALDAIGRVLFTFYWKNEDFAERYGEEGLAEFEDLLRGVFKSYGDMVLQLKRKSSTNADTREIMAV